MRLRWSKAYTTDKGREYGRWDISLPPSMIEALGWTRGDDLEAVAQKDSILIRKRKG